MKNWIKDRLSELYGSFSAIIMTLVLNYLLSFLFPNIFPFDINNFEWIPFFVTAIFFFIFLGGTIVMLDYIDSLYSSICFDFSTTKLINDRADIIGLVFLFLNPISVFYGLFFIDWVRETVGVIAIFLFVSWMYDKATDDDDFDDY